jgi:hypothetical protein
MFIQNVIVTRPERQVEFDLTGKTEHIQGFNSIPESFILCRHSAQLRWEQREFYSVFAHV